MNKLVIKSIKKEEVTKSLKQTITEVFLEATDNLIWLKKGDRVLLKPALNSPTPYPATTDPTTIETIKEILENRGAEVFVGDQSGIEHVLHDETGVIKGDSAKNFTNAGNKIDNFIAFEKEDWNKGFIHFQNEKTKSWPGGFYITKWINQVDHIISICRPSTHAQAGVTLGFKNLVGLLRLDSRMEFHSSGPFFAPMKVMSQKTKLKYPKDKENLFFQKIVEISAAIEDKLRLTFFTGTKAQTTFGPDARLIGLFKSYVSQPETGYVWASDNQVAAELFAIEYLTKLYKDVPTLNKLLQKFLIKSNGQIKEMGTYPPEEHPFIKFAQKLNMGDLNYKKIKL